MNQTFSDRSIAVKLEEERHPKGCQNWFGYLSQKGTQEPVPLECVECEKVVECMLNRLSSKTAVAEIKKWYQNTSFAEYASFR